MAETVGFLLCERGRRVDTRHVKTGLADGAKCGTGDWRPDMVLYTECIVYFIELTIPFEDVI